MFDRLLQMSERFDELEQIMVQPEIASNYSLLQSLIKEKKNLEPLVLKYRSYLSLQKQLNDAEELLHDPLLAVEAENEISSVRPLLSSLRDELELLLIPEDPLDSRNVILEIRAGVGGDYKARGIPDGQLLRNSLKELYAGYPHRSRGENIIVGYESAVGLVNVACSAPAGYRAAGFFCGDSC